MAVLLLDEAFLVLPHPPPPLNIKTPIVNKAYHHVQKVLIVHGGKKKNLCCL